MHTWNSGGPPSQNDPKAPPKKLICCIFILLEENNFQRPPENTMAPPSKKPNSRYEHHLSQKLPFGEHPYSTLRRLMKRGLPNVARKWNDK